METRNTAELSYDILVKSNTKLQKEAAIFHKVKNDEDFTKEDVRAYAKSQVEAKEDMLELVEQLRENYIKADYMPDVKKIVTFDNLIADTKANIEFYKLMEKEF